MSPLRKLFLSAALFLAVTGPFLATAQEQPPQAQEPAAMASLDGTPLQGTVVETVNTAGYTYLLLDGKQGKTWIAIPETVVKTGQTVTCSPGMTMHNFESKTLQRTFETIVFSPGIETSPAGAAVPGKKDDQPSKAADSGFSQALQAERGSGAAAVATVPGGGGEAMQQSAGSAGAIVPSADVNVNKASGDNSYSVAECFEKAADLNGKSVRIRGKVMKISRLIMGKNWLHLQDGTGDPVKNHHDLVVTTTEDPEENAVITVEGTLNANRDFGAGYKYEVIIENAKVVK